MSVYIVPPGVIGLQGAPASTRGVGRDPPISPAPPPDRIAPRILCYAASFRFQGPA